MPTPTPEVGALKASKVETAKKNKFTLAVTCDSAVACEGKIVVRTTRKVTVGNATKARKVLISKKSYSVEPGETEKVVLKVRKPARTVLATAGSRSRPCRPQPAPTPLSRSSGCAASDLDRHPSRGGYAAWWPSSSR